MPGRQTVVACGKTDLQASCAGTRTVFRCPGEVLVGQLASMQPQSDDVTSQRKRLSTLVEVRDVVDDFCNSLGAMADRVDRLSCRHPKTCTGAVASPILTDLSIYFAEQLRQVADLDIFERTHGVLDVPTQLGADVT